jgi:hypothetical protein
MSCKHVLAKKFVSLIGGYKYLHIYKTSNFWVKTKLWLCPLSPPNVIGVTPIV